MPILKKKHVNLVCHSKRVWVEGHVRFRVLALEGKIMTCKAPSEVFWIPVVRIWQCAPQDRII